MPISTAAPFCYPVARYMTAYYYDYHKGDNNNGSTMPPTALSASATGEGGGRATATMNRIIEAAMREIVQCGIISMTVNDNNSIDVVMMINANNGSLFGPMIAGAHLASFADALSGPVGPRLVLGVFARLLSAVIVAGLPAFILIR